MDDLTKKEIYSFYDSVFSKMNFKSIHNFILFNIKEFKSTAIYELIKDQDKLKIDIFLDFIDFYIKDKNTQYFEFFEKIQNIDMNYGKKENDIVYNFFNVLINFQKLLKNYFLYKAKNKIIFIYNNRVELVDIIYNLLEIKGSISLNYKFHINNYQKNLLSSKYDIINSYSCKIKKIETEVRKNIIDQVNNIVGNCGYLFYSKINGHNRLGNLNLLLNYLFVLEDNLNDFIDFEMGKYILSLNLSKVEVLNQIQDDIIDLCKIKILALRKVNIFSEENQYLTRLKELSKLIKSIKTLIENKLI